MDFAKPSVKARMSALNLPRVSHRPCSAIRWRRARPPVQAMIAFIQHQRRIHGAEPFRKVLPIAPSTCFDHQAKRADPDLLSARTKRDAVLLPDIERNQKAYFKVYAVHKRPCGLA
jgi:hypothetical protein